MPLINCEESLILTWSENYLITNKVYREAVAAQGNVPAVDGTNNPTGATSKITDTKLYVPVVTLSTQEENKLLQQLKTGLKRTIKLNKYRLEMSNQTKNSSLNYLIDPTFTKVSRLLVLSF